METYIIYKDQVIDQILRGSPDMIATTLSNLGPGFAYRVMPAGEVYNFSNAPEFDASFVTVIQ